MPFFSQHAGKIWDSLYTVYIPEQLTLQPEYIKRFGVHITQNKTVDEMLKTNLILVKITIATILQYYNQGIEVQIPSREDMIKMHKDIEAYLSEWKDYLRNSIHANIDIENNKELITSLEKLSKYIYEKATSFELLDNLYLKKNNPLGIINPLQRHTEQNKQTVKPDYEGIKHLITKRKPIGDSGGRF